ncbi:MAG: DUF5911 domain-containing protein [Acidimicrobiaceae bacterium]|nr:trehalose-phosphatase [Acidimicrobiia bacterium]MCY4493773.1 DUF5911 domain-containing protein [Acidimicrobiaceae bacterium]
MNRPHERPPGRLEEPELVPIENHSMLSDQRSAALVTPHAQINWLCVPRIDSPAIFAALLGGPEAGHFSITPLPITPLDGGTDAEPVQTYLDATLILQTSWPTLSVTDYLDCSDGRPQQAAATTEVIRHIEGTGRARVVFAPRVDFGRVPTRIEPLHGGLEVVGAADPAILRSTGVDWSIEDHGAHQSAVAEIDLARGPVTLQLGCGAEPSTTASPPTEPQRRELTARFWSDWTQRLQLPAVEPEMVRRSALTLKALTYGPTGAISAAATTSLPEFIGGVRNWDYRYCWLRDAAMSADALLRLGSATEAEGLLDWLSGLIDDHGVDTGGLSPLYTVDGRSLPPEQTVEELAGYAGSRPVRVGNAACHQLQLDVFGPVVELIHNLATAREVISGKHWLLVEAFVEVVEQRWTEPDQGIWEIRSAPRHHTHSKVMCWQTVDRALQISNEFYSRDRPDWAALRDRIRDDVIAGAWNEEAGTFTTAYDGTDLDASVLAIGLCGLVEPDDPRLAATVAAVEESLRHNQAVYRYTHEDGLPGGEGGFNLATSWLIDAKILTGDLDDARSLFESYLSLAGPTGLIPEEVDPETGAGLGNHPQAYSHLGLINNACNLARTSRGPRSEAPRAARASPAIRSCPERSSPQPQSRRRPGPS